MVALRGRVPPDADVASMPDFRGMQFEHAAQQGAPEDGHSLCCLAVEVQTQSDNRALPRGGVTRFDRGANLYRNSALSAEE